MLEFILVFPSGDDICGSFEPYVKYDCISYHSEAEFKEICENSYTGLDFLRNLGSYYSGQLVDNCDDVILKKISEIKDFHSLEMITIREKGSDSLGGKFDTVYHYSFITGRVSSVDIKQNMIDQSNKVLILFDTTLENIERVLSENGFIDEYEVVDGDKAIIVDKSRSDQIVSSLMQIGEYAAIELEDEDVTEAINDDANYPLDISKEEFLKWLGVKSVRSIKSKAVKEFVKNFYDYEFFKLNDTENELDLWVGFSDYVTIDTTKLTEEKMEKIILEHELI